MSQASINRQLHAYENGSSIGRGRTGLALDRINQFINGDRMVSAFDIARMNGILSKASGIEAGKIIMGPRDYKSSGYGTPKQAELNALGNQMRRFGRTVKDNIYKESDLFIEEQMKKANDNCY